MFQSIIATAFLANAVRGQLVGTYQTETHPTLTWEKYTAPNTYTTVSGKVVIDSNWRWVHSAASGSYTNCYTYVKFFITISFWGGVFPKAKLFEQAWSIVLRCCLGAGSSTKEPVYPAGFQGRTNSLKGKHMECDTLS